MVTCLPDDAEYGDGGAYGSRVERRARTQASDRLPPNCLAPTWQRGVAVSSDLPSVGQAQAAVA